MIVNKLDTVKGIGTFIRTPNGFKVTNPEGYVAIDRIKGNAVKLVDHGVFLQQFHCSSKHGIVRLSTITKVSLVEHNPLQNYHRSPFR